MTSTLGKVHLVRHGETAWSISGQHTGRSDIPLTAQGEENARSLASRLRGPSYALVLTSPLQRARRTAVLAGFAGATVEPDLAEWDYGAYEGQRRADIQHERPGWDLFRDGCPGGETAAQVGARADRVVARARAAGGEVLLFGHGHILRIVAARWLGLPAADGRFFLLGTAALGLLAYEHNDPAEPVIARWNDNLHLKEG